jgi:hypothetical protein
LSGKNVFVRRPQPSVIESPMKTTRFSLFAGADSFALSSR